MFKQGCIFISLLHAYIVCSARDDIRKPGAYGESVVTAVIQVLQENCLISDQMFLRRVAKIATNDGMNIQQHGGIWKVDSKKFNEINTHSNQLQTLLSVISGKLHIDWMKVRWSEMDKPLISGLAAALYLQSVPPESIPETIEEQASFYHRFYDNSTSAHDIYEKANAIHFKNCSDATRDIVFVIDSSADVTPSDIVYIKGFLGDVISNVPKNPDETKVSILAYNTGTSGLVYFNTHQIIDEVKYDLKTLNSTGVTDAGHALKLIATNVFDPNKGMRQYSAKSVVLITNDPSLDKTDAVHQAAMLKASGINVYAIGVGQSIDEIELKQIASSPACSTFLKVSEYSKLKVLKEELLELICSAPEILHVGQNIVPCDRISTIRIPGSPIGQTIEIIVEDSEQAVYGSFVTSRPNEVFNDLSGIAKPSQPLTLNIKNNNDLILKMDEASSCTGNITIIINIGIQDRSCNNMTSDVVFIIDSSSSVTDHEFQAMMAFSMHYVEGFDIGRGHMQVSVVTYADTYANQFWLNEYVTLKELKEAMGRVQRQHAGQRNTGKALKFVHENSFLSIHGGRQDAIQVIILLTKGGSSDRADTITVSQELHKAGTRVLTVVIGHDVGELNLVASDFKHLFVVDNISQLEQVKTNVAKISCGVVQIVCVEAGIVRNCTAREIQHSAVLNPGIPLPNICGSGLNMAPHPTDNTKYLMCDVNKQLLIVQCPLNEIFCITSQLCQTSCLPLTTDTTMTTSGQTTPTLSTTQVTTTLSSTLPATCLQNPCTQDGIGQYFPGCKDNMYIHCSIGGLATLSTCDPTKIWNQVITSCVNKYLLDNNKNPVKDYFNPCHGVKGDVYFPWPRDTHKYIHCDGYGDGFIMSCDGTKVWDQQISNCLPHGISVVG